MDRERAARQSAAVGGAFGGASPLANAEPTSPFERATAFEARSAPAWERPTAAAATTPGVIGGASNAAGAVSPGYAAVRRSYGAAGTPSLLGTRGRPTTKPTILEPPMEQAPIPSRTSLKRERELTFMDLERERARVTTPRRLEPSTHSPGPGALAREMEAPTPYQTPVGKPVTSAVTTDTARRILQRLDQLAGGRSATPATSAAPRPSLFATRQTQTPSPVSAKDGDDSKLTPTSATFVQTPKSGVSFAASPMPFISGTSTGRAPATPYPTGEQHEPEMETPKFTFGEDNVLLATGKKPKAPSGPVASVAAKFTFGEGNTTPLFPKKAAPPPVKTSVQAPPPSKITESSKSDDVPASKPVVNLWSADFLAKNQEHQKKVQAAIDEEEKATAKPASTPSPFAPAPAATGDKPAFSFGIPPTGSSAATSATATPFSFGSTAPAASGATATFSFGTTAPAKPAETAKPASDSGLLAFLGASSSETKTVSQPASAPTFTFGVPPKSPENVPVKDPEPKPAFTFGGPESKPAAPVASFSFGAKPAEPEKNEKLSASAPAFTPASTKTTDAPAPAPFTFGATPAKEEVAKPLFAFGGAPASDAKDSAPKPASTPFTFATSTTTASEAPKPASTGFTFGAAAATATKDEPSKPASGSFTFGGSSDTTKPASGGFTFGAAAKEDAPKPAAGGFTFGASTATTKDEAPKPASAGFTFGASSDAKPASAPFTFGASSAAASGAASGGFTFGGTTSTPATSGGGFTFGASTSAPSASNPFGGGLKVNAPKPSESVFGQSKADEQPNTPEPMSPFDSVKSPVGAAATGTSLFGGASTGAPAFGSAASANPFGGGSSAGANPFGASNSVPAFGAPAANPFGGNSSTPAFGAAPANPFGGGSSGPAFGGSAAPSPFGSASSAPAFGGAAPAPFGGVAPAAANPFSAGAAPTGGFSMGGGGGGGGDGGRKPVKKFKRPPPRPK